MLRTTGIWPTWTLRQSRIGSVLCLLVALLAQKTLDGQSPRLWPLSVLAFAGLSFALLAGAVDLEPRAEAVPGSSPLSTRFLLVLILLSMAGVLDMGGNLFRPRGVVLWVGGLMLTLGYLWLVSPPSAASESTQAQPRGSLWVPWHWWFLGGILLLGLWFRLRLVGEIPADMGFDLASKFQDALSILRGKYSIFFPMRLGREGLFFYATALMGKLFGLTKATLHLTSGVIGMVTILAAYQLARELFGVRTGLLAAFLLAVNRWHIVLSRSGFRSCTMPLFTAWSLYALLRALRTRRPLDWGLAGVAIGAGAYSYRSFLFVPLALGAGLGFYLLWHWPERHGLSQGLIIAVLVAAAIVAPLARYVVENPDKYLARQTYQTQFQVKLQDQAESWLTYLGRCLLVFNDQGDADSRFNYPYARQMGLASAALLVLGCAYVLLHPRSRAAAFLPSALLVLSLPAALSMLPQEMPSSLRLSGVIVPAVVLAAIPLEVIGRLWSPAPHDGSGAPEPDRLGLALTLQAGGRARTLSLNWSGGALVRAGLTIGAALLLSYEAAEAYGYYFRDYPTRLPDYANYSVTRTMAEVLAAFPDKTQEFVVAFPNWFDSGVLAMHLGVTPNQVPLLPTFGPDLPPVTTLGGAALFLLNVNDTAGLETLQAAFPAGILVEHLYPNGQRAFLAFYADR